MQTENITLFNLLLVEDNPGDARLIKEMLFESGNDRFFLKHFDAMQPAIDYLNDNDIDVILLDLSLPDSHGLDTFETVFSAQPKIPIIVLTGLEDHRTAIETVQKGAQDYLVKGKVEGGLLIRAIEYAIERQKLREKVMEANQKIIDQQKLQLEEERLNVLLEMAGATAHELNQPLTVLMNKVQLLPMIKDNAEKLDNYLDSIQRAATRISEIVQKIQNIRSYDTKDYAGGTRIINFDQN